MMESISFPQWTQALGWALLNSVWQGLLIFLVLFVALRFIRSEHARLRYALACVALGLVFVCAAVTFGYVLNNLPAARDAVATVGSVTLSTPAAPDHAPAPALLDRALDLITRNMPWILLTWLTGALVFALRLLGGLWYVRRLRTDCRVLENEWSALLKNLASRMKIGLPVALAESVRVNAPVVVGYLKPVVLIPVGMLSGMSTEQVETIFVHELAHIRRHDYLVNIVQSVVETIFFFNPFTWMLSAVIRREREFCCDDEVLRCHANSMAYARALASIEAARLERPVLALSLAQNKNQLLNRIKRMMEKSTKNYSTRDRWVPLVLLAVGLVCASWLTLGPDRYIDESGPGRNALGSRQPSWLQDMPTDTVDKDKKRSAYYSRKTITTYDENGEPHQEVVEEFRGDEELRDLMDRFNGDANMFPLPAVPGAPDPVFPPLPNAFFDLNNMPFGNFDMAFDTIPAPFRDEGAWEDFRHEFEERFEERFDSFFQSHEKEIGKMMDEMEESFGANWHDQMQMLRRQTEMAAAMQMRQAEALQRMKEKLADSTWRNQMNAMEAQMRRAQAEVAAASRMARQKMAEVGARFETFQQVLAEQLVKDNYLQAGESIRSIRWDEGGDLIINDTKIKAADRKKYEEIRDRYLGTDGNFRYVE